MVSFVYSVSLELNDKDIKYNRYKGNSFTDVGNALQAINEKNTAMCSQILQELRYGNHHVPSTSATVTFLNNEVAQQTQRSPDHIEVVHNSTNETFYNHKQRKFGSEVPSYFRFPHR